MVILPLLVPCPQGLETLLQNLHPYRGLILVVPTLWSCSDETFTPLLEDLNFFPHTLSFFLPLSFLFTTKALPFFSFSPECSEYTYHGFLVGEVAHASALLTLQEWEWLGWKVLERRPLDTKELGHFLSRKASLTSYGLASVSDSSGSLI